MTHEHQAGIGREDALSKAPRTFRVYHATAYANLSDEQHDALCTGLNVLNNEGDLDGTFANRHNEAFRDLYRGHSFGYLGCVVEIGRPINDYASPDEHCCLTFCGPILLEEIVDSFLKELELVYDCPGDPRPDHESGAWAYRRAEWTYEHEDRIVSTLRSPKPDRLS